MFNISKKNNANQEQIDALRNDAKFYSKTASQLKTAAVFAKQKNEVEVATKLRELYVYYMGAIADIEFHIEELGNEQPTFVSEDES